VIKGLRLPLWLEIAATILAALAISNLATSLFFQFEGEQRLHRFGDEMLADRIAATSAVILNSPTQLRPKLLAVFSTPSQRFTIDTKPIVGNDDARDANIEARIASRLPEKVSGAIRVRNAPRGERLVLPPGADPTPLQGRPDPPERMIVSLGVDPDHWLNGRVNTPGPPPTYWPTLFSGGVAAVALLLAAIWIGGRVAVPLQRLAEASRAMRRGEPSPPVPETGPAAVRDATRSFNAMSQRLLSTLDSQRAMMAAIAHDLRTPIASLRLRVEFVQDEEAKARLLETLGEMQAMTEAVLDAARTGRTGEAARVVDISALAESLASDMAEIGGDVAFVTGEPVRCTCRANEIRRALRNLIENAMRYGKRARVSVAARGDVAEIFVDDDGPGIPPEELERVFEPFARLEQSRSRETGGYGLGLSIARLIARGHGGDVTLTNKTGGGLCATLSLPLGG
jgi:signal transduction histidine kinase